MSNPKFLREIQAAGWLIKAVDEGIAYGACPRSDCGLTVKLRSGTKIPEACKPGPALAEVLIERFDDARIFLRDRRDALLLTIREVEEVAGISVDFLAKFEKDDPSKIPNTQTFIEWAQALGYEVVLRPGTLPAYALRTISNTRAVAGRRKTMLRHSRARRASASQSEP